MVIGVFRKQNPGNPFFLLFYALVLKGNLFLHPYLPVLNKEDNYLYRYVLKGLRPVFQQGAIWYSILSFALLFLQALLFNRICNYHKLFPRPNFLPAMTYLLLTSLLPDWGHFSAPLLINLIMIWVWYRMIELYNNPHPVTAIFNIGLLTGLASLLYIPAMCFLLMLPFALILMRPFRVQEWLVGFLGFTAPYYFVMLIFYFAGQLHWNNALPHILVTLPAMPASLATSVGLFLLLAQFIIGGYFVQNNLNKMLIQVRKAWSLLLVYLIAAVLVIQINRANSYENWIVTAVPFSAFCAAAYYYPNRLLFPRLLHWACFAYVLWVSYF